MQFTPLLGSCRDSGGNNSVDIGGDDDNGSDYSVGDGDRHSSDDSNSGSNTVVVTATAAGIDNNQ